MTRFQSGALLLFALVSTSLSADTMKGNFHFGNVRFDAVDAIAYQVDVKDEKAPLTIVALTDFKIDRPGVMAAIDPIQALYTQSGEKGNFVTVRIASPDHCSVAGWLASTQQQIDLGGFSGKNTVSANSRVNGECATKHPEKLFDDEYDFKFSYDVPITVVPKPTTLTAGGGDAGSQYLALLKAIQARDWTGAHLHVPEGSLPDTKAKVAESNYFENLELNYPKASATVTGGLMKGDRAQIDIAGMNHDGRKINGTVMMKKVGSDWRVIDQQFYGTE